MHLDGLPSVRLGSVRDKLRLAAWYRREQKQLYETMMNVYSAVITVNPEVLKKVQGLIEDYFEIVIPGSRNLSKKAEETTLKAQASALDSIYKALKAHSEKPGGK